MLSARTARGAGMFLLPYITLVLYWVAYGIYRLATRNRVEPESTRLA